MSNAAVSEQRRKELLLKVPAYVKSIADLPTVPESSIDAEELPRYRALCLCAKYFLQKRSVSEIAAAANMRAYRALDYLEKAFAPWKEGTGITGTRAFVRFLVQSDRTRTADLEPLKPDDAPSMGGFGGMFGKLFRDHPSIEVKLTNFLNGLARPNKVNPKTLLTKFQAICREEKLTDSDYPLRCRSQGFKPLMTWFKTKYVPENLLAHIKRNAGKAAAVAASYELGDGETRTPACDYLVWVIDECDSNIDTKVEIPGERWGGEVVGMRRFPVLRLRSVGDYAMNIAFQVCFTRQAKGSDVIKLFRNAVLGQPAPPMVDPDMLPKEGAGFPQNIFEQLRFVVPAIVYLDNALAHLFNDLQELLTRLFGGRVVLGAPGVPKGRPEIESSIHKTRKSFILQLPGALGSGPQDPLRKNAERPTEQLLHANHIEQGLYCVLANENVSDSASAGYLDAFTRMKQLLARGSFEANVLPEHLRAPHNFSAPKRRPVKCEITKSGRLPHIWLGRRYSSEWLKLNPPDGVKEYWILQDYDDLRTAILLDDNMTYVDTLKCEGAWGRVPHDDRILQIYNSRKHAARFKTQARDLPLFQVLQFLADGAKSNWSMAQDFAYFMTYLKRMVSPEELAAAQIEYGGSEVPLTYNDGYVPPSTVSVAAKPAAAPVPTHPSGPPAAPRRPGPRFAVPRGMR